MALTISVEDIISTTNNPLLQAKPHWTRVRLGDVATVLNGYAFKAELFNRTQGVPLIRIRDVGSNDSQTLYSGEFESKYLVQPGELLIGMDGDFNCARWCGKPSLLNQRVCKVSISPDAYEDRFLDLVLPGYLKAINDATSSITVKHLSSRTIQDIPLPCPPIDEQREIVAEIEKQFSRLDEAVANLKRVKANLKRYKASVLKDAVEGRLVPTEAELARREGRSFETGEQLLQRILETRRRQWRGKFKAPVVYDGNELPVLPVGWSWASLDSLAWDSRYGTSAKCSYENTGSAVLRIPNVQNGSLDLTDLKFSASDFVLDPAESVSEGDLLVIRTNGSKSLIGRAAIVLKRPTNEISFASYLIRFRLVNESQLPSWVSVVWQTSRMRSWIESRAATSAGQHNISMTVLATAAIPLPPFAEQTRIVAEVDRRLSLIRGVEAEVDANLKRAQVLRQSILRRAFSGERALNDSSESNVTQVEPLIEPNSLPTESASVVMAARIVAANCSEPTFGRVKLQKILYLAIHHGQVQAVNDEYTRKQAGPSDMQMLGGVIKRLGDLHWFREAERAGKSPKDKGYSYSALTKADDHKRHLHVLTPTQQKVIDDLNQLMHTWSTEDCELFATVYAAWNDLILLKHELTVDAITYEVRENWHESKKRFSAAQVSEMIDKIKRLGYEPTGFGRPTSGKAVDTQTGELF